MCGQRRSWRSPCPRARPWPWPGRPSRHRWGLFPAAHVSKEECRHCVAERGGYLWLTTLWPDMSRVGLSWWTTLRWMAHGYRGRSSWRINCLSGSMGILTRRPSRLEKPLYLSQHRASAKTDSLATMEPDAMSFPGASLSGGRFGWGKWEMGNLWEMAQGSDAFAVVERQSCPKMCAGRTGTTKHSPPRPICSSPHAGPGTARRQVFSYSIPDGTVSISISIPLLSFAFLNPTSSPLPPVYPLHFLPSSILILPGPLAFPSRADLCRQLTTTTTTTTPRPSSRCP